MSDCEKKHFKRVNTYFGGNTDDHFINMARDVVNSKKVKNTIRNSGIPGIPYTEAMRRRKIKEANIGEKNPMYGKARAEETLAKQSKTMSALYSTEEARAGLRERALANMENNIANLNKAIEANKRHVVCNGVKYNSIKEATAAVNHLYPYIKRKCEDPAHPDWYFVDK